MAKPAEEAPEAAAAFERSVRAGEPWFESLLRGIGDWTLSEETRNGRRYRYLISGEAFNMLLLAERLLEEVDGLVPAEDKERLLFAGRAPEEIDTASLRERIGAVKHGAHLNYWYGVVVEQSLQQAVLEEVAKARQSLAATEESLEDEAFRRLYDATRRRRCGTSFAGRPRAGRVVRVRRWMSTTRSRTGCSSGGWPGATPARLASDTMKGLRKLEGLDIPRWHWAALPG